MSNSLTRKHVHSSQCEAHLHCCEVCPLTSSPALLTVDVDRQPLGDDCSTETCTNTHRFKSHFSDLLRYHNQMCTVRVGKTENQFGFDF